MQATVQAANYYISQISGMENATADFKKLFDKVAGMKSELGSFTGQVTEHNYTEKAAHFIVQKDRLHEMAKEIAKTQRFIRTNLAKASGMERFVNALEIELQKAHVDQSLFSHSIKDFRDIFDNALVEKYADLNQVAIKIKDQYYELMVDANAQMNAAYQKVKATAESTLWEIKKYPEDLNKPLIIKAERLLNEAKSKLNDKVELEFHISDQRSHLSLSEMQNATDLAPIRENDIEGLLLEIIKEADTKGNSQEPREARRLKVKSPKTSLTAGEYRQWLNQQIKTIQGIPNEDPLEIDWTKETQE